ncbi:MAG: UvrD-helicase domain-containing protein [Clostridia bacterium]|nr:UvrD-helicase domain-containing protein [Clostridia bacterium]
MARSWTTSQEAAMTLRGKTLLVSAAAGSGKTSVLTERIIRSLLDKEHPADLSRMLVVTFTRAAAAELKARISTALSEALAQNPGDKHLSNQLFLLGSAQISTIDSFFQKIVRENFDVLGLPASFRIADDAEVRPLAAEILCDVISEFYEKFETESSQFVFDRIVKNPFAKVVDHLMTNRSDGKLNEILAEFLNTLTAYPQGISLLKENAERLRAQKDMDFLTTDYGAALRSYLLEQFSDWLTDLDEVKDYLDSAPDDNARLGGLVASDLDYCRNMKAALEEASYLRAQAVGASFSTGRFPTIKEKTSTVLFYQEWRNKWKTEQKKIGEYFAFSPEEITRQMEQTADLCQMLYDFYSVYTQRLLQEKKARGILEFDDIRGLLYQLLTGPDGVPSDFAQQLSRQYDAVYIDEYQDVDYLQDTIFSILGGTRRFMVGDIKQSIYGFRGSEPSIFAEYRKAMPLYNTPAAENANGACVFMSENFRCDSPVIEFTNQICSFLFSACEASIQYRPQDDLVCAKPAPEAPAVSFPSPVCVSVFDKRAKNDEESETSAAHEEATWVAAEISRLIRTQVLDNGAPITPSDIAILVRTKAQGEAYQHALEELRVPVNLTASSNLLYEEHAVNLLNLLRAVDNPYRDLPLSEFLLSPLGGFSLEELSQIRAFSPDEKSLYDAMSLALAEGAPFEEDLRQRIVAFLDWMELQRENANAKPADLYMRQLYLDERLVPYSREPALLYLYEQARIYQRSSWCGLYGFLQHVDKLTEGGNVSAGGFLQAEEAVTIMTVHHSKGLEFPVVFLASCGAPFNKRDLTETLVYHKNLGLATKLYSPSTGNTNDTLLRMAVKQEIGIEQTEESIRTLYVALTRARERLYVTGTLSGKWENAVQNAGLVKKGNRHDILSCNSYLAWILAALQQKEAKSPEFPCTFQHIPAGKVEIGIPLSPAKSPQELSSSPLPNDPVATHYASVLEQSQRFQYPLDFLQGLPTKAAASKLTPDLLDLLSNETEDDLRLEKQIELMQTAPHSFEAMLRDRQSQTAAEIGTATHAFLEFCDFRRFYESDIDAECAHLIKDRFLLPSDVELLHREQLAQFAKSNLMQWILQAKALYREQKFGLHIPMGELTQRKERRQQLSEHTLFVQGSMDLFLIMPDGKRRLIDYKTDHVTDWEREHLPRLVANMKKKHGTQLLYYAKACKALFGAYPDEIYIYSLPLGQALEIPLEL